jgi:DNA-binding transcriptional MerR regulator
MQLRRTQAVARSTAERDALTELERWSTRAVPDDSAPLDADDLVRLFRDCISALALDADIASGFTVNTVHYYRRKGIIDPPHGRTAAARYHRRHLWQIAGARLAGYLGLVTLAEARDAFRDADEDDLRAFLATRIVEARARDALRAPPLATVARERPRPLPGVRGVGSPASLISLPGGAMCVLPAEHHARHSREGARDLVRALARALNVTDSL